MGLRNALHVQRHLSDRRFSCIAEFEQGTLRPRAGNRTVRIDGGRRVRSRCVRGVGQTAGGIWLVQRWRPSFRSNGLHNPPPDQRRLPDRRFSFIA